MSVIWVSRLMLGLIKCERSPSPVSVGVKTSWPALRSASAFSLQHQPPIQAPWTRTKFAKASPTASACHLDLFDQGGRLVGVPIVFQSNFVDAAKIDVLPQHARVTGIGPFDL